MSELPQMKPAANTGWAVEANAVVQRYYDTKLQREKTVLDKIDLNLRGGEFCAVVGPSGCGKSTFLRLILGQEKQKEGQLELFGDPPLAPDRNRGIVYQKYSLFPHLRVVENVALGLELEEVNFLTKWLWYPGFIRKHRKFIAKANDYLERVGLAEHAQKYPYQLSGGQQQRVAIAQALAMEPKILLMDEPFGALDPGTREDLQDWMLEIHRTRRGTVFFVTHDIEEAVYLATRVLVFSQFRTSKSGKPEGSKIVADLVPPECSREELRKHPEFPKMVGQIIEAGFQKERPKSPAEFPMTHPDAIPTKD